MDNYESYKFGFGKPTESKRMPRGEAIEKALKKTLAAAGRAAELWGRNYFAAETKLAISNSGLSDIVTYDVTKVNLNPNRMFSADQKYPNVDYATYRIDIIGMCFIEGEITYHVSTKNYMKYLDDLFRLPAVQADYIIDEMLTLERSDNTPVNRRNMALQYMLAQTEYQFLPYYPLKKKPYPYLYFSFKNVTPEIHNPNEVKVKVSIHRNVAYHGLIDVDGRLITSYPEKIDSVFDRDVNAIGESISMNRFVLADKLTVRY